MDKMVVIRERLITRQLCPDCGREIPWQDIKYEWWEKLFKWGRPNWEQRCSVHGVMRTGYSGD